MTTKERLRYFADYYLGKIVITVIVVVVLISIAVTMLRPRPETMLSVAVADDSINQSLYDELQARLDEILLTDKEKQETVFDTGYYLASGDYQAWQKYSVFNMVGDIDVTLMPKSTFEAYAPGSHFSPVSPYLSDSLYAALEPYLLKIALKDDAGNVIPDSEDIYGIDLSSTWVYQNVEEKEPMILAINLAPKHKENIEKLLMLLFFPDDAK